MFWKFFNLFGRLFGWSALLVGSLIALSNIPLLLDPNSTTNINGIEETDLFYKLVSIILPAIMALLGWLIIKSKPFNPLGGTKNNE